MTSIWHLKIRQTPTLRYQLKVSITFDDELCSHLPTKRGHYI